MLAHDTCSHCGAGIYKDRMSPKRQAIYDLVRRRPGLTSEEIVDIIYANYPNGGVTRQTIKSHIQRINKDLKRKGLRIWCRDKQWSGYHLTSL